MSVAVIDLLEHARIEVLKDVASPQLWGDDALLKFLNDAYQRFARTTHCFIDDEATIETVANVVRYALPSDTIHLRQVSLDNWFLAGFTRKAKPRFGLVGKPRAYTTDSAQRTVKLYPAPDAVYTLTLERAVLPAQLDFGSSVDLDFEFAYLLVQWVAYQAMATQDPDKSNIMARDAFYRDWYTGVRSAKAHFTRMAMGDDPTVQPRKWT